jgi:flagellar protein FliJ
MKKFQFRLEKVLQLKKHTETEKRKNLGMANHNVHSQNQKLLGLLQTRVGTQQKQRELLGGKVNIMQQLGYSRYYLRMKRDELTGRELLKAMEKEREKKRIELVEATRQKKIYEKLKERQQDKYSKELNLALQKEQDEMAAQSYLYRIKLPVN